MLMNQLALCWGTKVFYYDRDQDVSTDDLIEDIKQILVERGELQSGDVFYQHPEVSRFQDNVRPIQ
ncbi:hypothetical protein PEC18_10215 [Paucibacter sp. O1-1]|nr:hypothetical protein [Paucibacter sp. O1-1]MDA3826215.1 hypothetical protein [Paucibacter sp. O1-1]